MAGHLTVPVSLEEDHPPPLSLGTIRKTYRSPPTVSGFAPLPPITASPICTSAASAITYAQISNQLSSDGGGPVESSSGYLTPPTTPSEGTHHVPLPTWVAVPPTPPAKLLARYLTCEPGQPRSPQLPPSVSSPASHPTRDSQMKYDDPKRRASFPLHKTDISAQAAVSTLVPSMPEPVSSENIMVEKAFKRPLFHVEDDAVSDGEEVVIPFVDSPPDENQEELLVSIDEDKRKKEQIRRYFVLLELLSTEIGYLTDLQTLVRIYLRLLSTWPCKGPGTFTRNSSFTTVPRLNPSHLQPHNVVSFTSAEIRAPTTLHSSWDKDKPVMFSTTEMTLLSRNIVDVLELHERFVDELRLLMEGIGFPVPSDDAEVEHLQQHHNLWIDKVDDATRAVSAKFATEASRFNSYQTFCAGHSEALTLVHKAQHQYPTEWKQFQRQCSLGSPSTEEPTERPHLQQEYEIIGPDRSHGRPRNRTQSTSSTDSIIQAIRRRSRTESSDGILDINARQRGNRLNFTDYLIKPIQRICKYPLLLEQLKSRSVGDKSSEDLDVVVESATQAMRHVATAVDEARHRQEISIRSSLIALRVGSTLSFPNTTLSSTRPSSCLLTPSFLSSLGMCLLAGSLDVMHAKGPSIPKTAKYYGAFLYPGGYLILVKVKGKGNYEPRHWFPLSGMGVVDIDISEALFPFSFGLSYKSHRFELAASCQREKEIWLASIKESLTSEPGWINEPTSSLNAELKGDINACDQLPTPESGGSIEGHIPSPLKTTEPTPQTPILEETRASFDSSPRVESTRPLASRRSSTTSVKAIFTSSMTYHPPSPTMIISRSSPTARTAVDQALQDVISEVCISARSQANNREESLFPVYRSSQTNRSLGKNRLSRHESVRVVRKKSFVIEGSDFGLLPPIPSRARSLVVRPSICVPQGEGDLDELANSLGELRPTTRSNTPSSVSSSPVRVARTLNKPYKETRSMIGDLRELFGSRLASSSSSSLQDNPKRASSSNTNGFSLLRRWSRSVRHRRANSAPELPEESQPQPTTELNPVLPDIDFGSDLSLPGTPNSATSPIASYTPL